MRKYIAPRLSSVDTREARFVVPCSPDMIAIIRGLLVSLIDPEKWESYDWTITAEEAAQAAQAMLDSFEANL